MHPPAATLDDPAVLDADVAHLAVDPVGGIVDRAAGDPKPARRSSRPPAYAPRSSARAARPSVPPPDAPPHWRSQRQRHVVHPVARYRPRGCLRRRCRSRRGPAPCARPGPTIHRRCPAPTRRVRPSAAPAPATSTASAPPARAAEPASGRDGIAGSRPGSSPRIGYPVCQVSAASAPERFPPARSALSAARVGPLRACVSAMRLSARWASRAAPPGLRVVDDGDVFRPVRRSAIVTAGRSAPGNSPSALARAPPPHDAPARPSPAPARTRLRAPALAGPRSLTDTRRSQRLRRDVSGRSSPPRSARGSAGSARAGSTAQNSTTSARFRISPSVRRGASPSLGGEDARRPPSRR